MNTAGKKILVIDNHDSFVFNIVQYLNEIGAVTTVVTNSEISPDFAKDFAGVVISPGPGAPESAGVSEDYKKHLETGDADAVISNVVEEEINIEDL